MKVNKDGSVDITRTAMDSYPVKSTLKLQGNNVDLTGWTTYMYYTEIQPDDTGIVVRITGAVNSPKTGVAKFYPREMYCYNVTNLVAYRGMAMPGKHDYSIVRTRLAYEPNVTGNYVMVDGEYVAYDSGNTAHDDLPRYSEYTETMTHVVGTMLITERAGL